MNLPMIREPIEMQEIWLQPFGVEPSIVLIGCPAWGCEWQLDTRYGVEPWYSEHLYSHRY